MKSSALLIDCVSAYNKSFSVEEVGGSETEKEAGEDSFEKVDKKLYSNYGHALSFIYTSCAGHLTTSTSIYSVSVFKEPLRVVLTPPPNAFL